MWIQLSINGTKKGDGVNGKENMIKIDWKLLPDWVNYVVMDDDGSWYAYEKKPVTKLNYGEWNENSEDGRVLPLSYFIDWKDSLITRNNDIN